MEVDPTTGMITDVRLDIRVPPGFPEKYHGALIRSAEQCAVKKHLEHPPRFTITAGVDPGIPAPVAA
jgi:ribosomal protein S12 methylthiotransferase accessory factor